MQPNKITPPEWPLRFLRSFVKKEYLEEIEGDMEEIFNDHVERHSYKRQREFTPGKCSNFSGRY